MNLDAYKVATQCSFLIMKVNNPLGTWQVIPGNVRFGYHSSFLLNPFLNITSRKEIHRKRIRLLISRVPALYSLVLGSLDEASSLYSAADHLINHFLLF